MIKIQLDNEIWLTSDTHQFMLSKKRNNNFEHFGFYAKLDSALKDYVSTRMRASNSKSIQELLDFLKSLNTALNEAIQPLEIEVRLRNTMNRQGENNG